MKINLLITALLLGSISVKGQTKHYYKAEIKYTLDCSSGYSSQTITGDSYANYNTIKSSFKKWVYPHRIISFEITSLKEVKRKDINHKKEKFKCPVPISFGTPLLATSSYFQSCDTCTYSTLRLTAAPTHFYPAMVNIPGLTFSLEAKPNFDKIDSLIMKLNKSQIKWLNDSTAIIYKQLIKK